MNVVVFIQFCILIVHVFSKDTKSRQFTRIQNTKLKSGNFIYSTLSVIGSAIHCCNECAKLNECTAVAVSKTSKQCVMLVERFFRGIHLDTNSDWNVYIAEVTTEWYLVFRATAGVNIPVFSTWEGTTVTNNPPECHDVTNTACNTHFRKPVIDSWTSCDVQQVKFELYENGVPVAMVIFNGQGSDALSWFAQDRVLNTSWSHFSITDNFAKFRLNGNNQRRRALITKNLGCSIDEGFLLVLDTSGTRFCSYEAMAVYPQFLYSKTENTVTWFSKGYGMADTLAVYWKAV